MGIEIKGEMFSEDDYNEIVKECRKFKRWSIDPDEKEVYLQLVHEKEIINGVGVTFDIYPYKFLYYLMDNVFTTNSRKIPLFSYQLDLKIETDSYVYREYKTVAQKNKGWLAATLCDKDDPKCDFVGQLTWQCGDVDFLEVGIKMRHGISDAILKDIANITSELRKKHLKNLKNLDIERKSGDSAVKTSYDIYLYRVGNANTTYV